MRNLSLPAMLAVFWLASAAPAFAIDFADPDGDIRARNEFNIGVDLVQHGKYEIAARHLEAALEKFPDDISILKYLAFIHLTIARHRVGTAYAGEVQLANTYYTRALDIDPDDRNLLEYMGEFYLELNDPDSAREKMAALERRCPKGCPQADALAHSIANYAPPPPPLPHAATASPEPLAPDVAY
jgi:tetratricopeptide (TPR) repeat protein